MPRKTIKSLEAQIETLHKLREGDADAYQHMERRVINVNNERRQWEDRCSRAEKELHWLRTLIEHIVELAKVRA